MISLKSAQASLGVSTGSASRRRRTRMHANTTKTAELATETNTREEIAAYVRGMPGVCAPFPEVFDPAGIEFRARNIAEIRRWRESELVHGRVAMLAALGFVVGEQLEDFPAFLNFDGGISGVPAVYQFQAVELTRPFFWEILLVAIGLAESYRVAVGWAQPRGSGLYQLADDYEPGDLGFDPLGLRPEDPEAFKTMQTKELNNGRLAMIAIAGFVAQELVVKREIFEHLATYLADVVVEDVVQPAEKAVGIPLTQPPQPLPAEPTIPPNVSEIFR